MKIFITFAILLVIFVGLSEQRCAGTPNRPSCTGNRDAGRRGRIGRFCNARDVWYYDATANLCRKLRYLGCGGNDNRHCTKAACERQCRRAI